MQKPVPGGLPAQLAGALLRDKAVEPSHHRNPMYLAIAAAVTGQGLLLGQPKLLAAVALGALPVTAFVRFYEEPALARKFGTEYQAYRDPVPRWLPRLTPWRPESPSGTGPAL